MRISNEVLNVLGSADVDPDDHLLRLTSGQLDRNTYVAVDKVLKAMGGKWDRKLGGHVFTSDPTAALELALATGEVVDGREEFGAFYTPAAVADRVTAAATIESWHRVLEPSAGEGALALRAAELARNVTAFELRDGPWEWAEQHPRVALTQADFLSVEPTTEFERVVMNPPFDRRQSDVRHVLHAHKFLCDGGVLVSIMSPAWQFRITRLADEFRETFDSHNGTVADLGEGAFRESGTMVRTVMVTLDAPS